MKLFYTLIATRMTIICILAATVAIALPSATATAATVELASFRGNEFPEGLTVGVDGTVYVGILNTGEILRVTPAGQRTSFARVPLGEGSSMVGLAVDTGGDVWALVWARDQANGVWWVSRDGSRVAQFARLPVGSLPNDLIIDTAARIYVTDTIGGRIFRVLAGGVVETWVEDRLLLGNVANPGPFGFPLGANGIALAHDGQSIYVGVAEMARLVRIPILQNGGPGTITVVAEDRRLAGADGIAVGPGGVVYLAVNEQNHIATVDPATRLVNVVASGEAFHFPASVRFSPDFRRYYVPNFDGPVLFGLAPGPARTGLLAVDVVQTAPIAPPQTGDGGLRALEEERAKESAFLIALLGMVGLGVWIALRRVQAR